MARNTADAKINEEQDNEYTYDEEDYYDEEEGEADQNHSQSMAHDRPSKTKA